jgi:hypothetical protein
MQLAGPIEDQGSATAADRESGGSDEEHEVAATNMKTTRTLMNVVFL